MSRNFKVAFFLVGPTAAGKTSVTQWIAEHYSYDILSADAMMVYRGMDVGTAKPSREFRSNVRYWGLDLVSPKDHFSVGMYRQHALAAVRKVISADRRLIATGGTGLYIKSLTHGLCRLSAGNPDIRAKAGALRQKGGLGALQAWVKTQAPEKYEALADKQNPRRLVRAIETAQDSTGNKNNSWRRLGKGPKIAGLIMPKNLLDERIKLRIKEMYSAGLLDETEQLLRQGIEIAPTADKAIGYAEAINFLHGKSTLDEAMELTAKRTRQLAKRQMTWFKHQANVEWLTIDSSMTTRQIAQVVLDCWKKIGPTPIMS